MTRAEVAGSDPDSARSGARDHTRVEITIYRVTVTDFGASLGWTVATLCDEVLEVGAPTMATGPELH
jgi:hypothetical protein